MSEAFPFSAVVGAEDAKLALLLVAVEPRIGGVLLRGEKGSAKTTLARGLAGLLPGEAPFVDLPVGATEDRVIGSIDLAAALTGSEVKLRRGLLADADGGVLYVDEVNLLPDHLVDALLDVAASGVNRVEREGTSVTHPARFVLIGSMNPEEGELRPQLLDRFGLALDVRAPTAPEERAEAVRRRLSFDSAGATDVSDGPLAERLARCRQSGPAALAPDLVERVSRICVAMGAEGLRADIVICRAAAALARWEGRDEATDEDVRRVAPWALAHRARRGPLDQVSIDQERLERALRPTERVATPDPETKVTRIEAHGGTASGRRSTAEGPRGRLVGDRPAGDDDGGPVAVGATVRAVAVRRAVSGEASVDPRDLRTARREQRTANLVVLAVDASGSMGAARRMEAAKGAVLSLLVDSYQRRDRVALVTFRGDSATVALRPTGSVEVGKARLAELPTGGKTPLAAGIRTALEVAMSGSNDLHEPLIVLVTDGRATGDADASPAARAAAAEVKRRGIPAVVVDVEDGPSRLGLAGAIAAEMGARLVTLAELTPARLTAAVESALPVR